MKTGLFNKKSVLLLLVVMSLLSMIQPSTADADPCAISVANPSPGEVGIPFTLTLTASGADHIMTFFTWTFSWNPSPVPGLSGPSYAGSKEQQVSFSGTPTTPGSYTVTATVEDTGKAKCSSNFVIQTVTINAPPTGLTITTLSLPNGRIGFPYSKTLSSSGGTTPYSWSATGLPSGLSINSSSGIISGTPAGIAGSYNVTVTLTDSAALPGIDTKSYVLTIDPASLALEITSTGLPDGDEGVPYSYALNSQGGTPPYLWSASGLPSGLSINSVSGQVTGTPNSGTAGDHNVTISLSDSAAGSTSKSLTIHINASVASVSPMYDYCSTPPFINQEIPPNVLLFIDNSSSMYDMKYIDGGTATRDPFYCYDKTYQSTMTYGGYFTRNQVYTYSFANKRFQTTASIPIGCTYLIPNTLCITTSVGTPKTVTQFAAIGNYLNWLTASKFDIQKKILTGGKYDPVAGNLLAESRGCVGKRFIKEALTEDYVEGGSNTSLGITFAIRGPLNPYNQTAPSLGGQTSIEIFEGAYDEGLCQTAIEVFNSTAGHQEKRDAAAACLKYNKYDSSLPGKTKNVFIQAIQECWQYETDGTVSNDALNTVKNQCPDIYDGYSPGTCTTSTTCSVDSDCSGVGAGSKCVAGFCTGASCTTDGDCPGQTCLVGPKAILPGNPSLLCSNTYAGACYDGRLPYNRNGFTDDACIIQKHNQYCGDFEFSTVIDPTDDTDTQADNGNVPAILGDLGVEGQLGLPVAILSVKIQSATPTESVVNKFAQSTRIGLMVFNKFGSAECITTPPAPGSTPTVRCPKICSVTKSLVCTDNADCPPGESCVATTANVNNLDGGQIQYNIGDPIGNHNSGLIKQIDDIRAATWTPFAEGFYNAIGYLAKSPSTGNSRTDLRLNTGDFDATKNPSQSKCQDNYILMISDGMSTADQNSSVNTLANNYNDGDGQTGSCTSFMGSKNLDDLAWLARNRDITSFDKTGGSTDAPTKRYDFVSTYTVFTGAAGTETGECNSATLLEQTAVNGGGEYFQASDEQQLRDALYDAFFSMTRKAASGTAASVLASGEGSGANLIQAVFYPAREFTVGASSVDIKWIGRLTNLWYFVDPFFGSSAIYEDNASTKVLNLTDDYRVTLDYNAGLNKTVATRMDDTDDDGKPDTALAPIEFEKLNSLWDAGFELWKRNLTTTPRKIKTTIGSGLTDFSTTNASTLRPYLQAANNTEAANIINYIHGFDVSGYRSRTVSIDLNGNNLVDAGETNVWKLSDIIQSTPRIASRFPLNTYDQVYLDSSYKAYISSVDYRNRGMVFGGANDGMLHAFNLGKLELDWGAGQGQFEKARLTGSDFGKELWAFIPKNVLPYLKYIGDPNYCHLYSVDLSPYIFDASIGAPAAGDISETNRPTDGTYANWRTILVGGMRFGGACKASNNSTCTDCIKAPGVDISGDGTVSGAAETQLGFSSYFALDVTDTLNNPSLDPTLLWEFTSPDLGLASTGATIVRISSLQDPADPSSGPDRMKNGKWFVVIASGPTGPIAKAEHQMLGRSDQDLRIFVLDLKTGTLLKTFNTGIANAFGGSLINATHDLDLDYQDDILYVPYTQKCTLALSLGSETICTAGDWNNGGIVRIKTNENRNPNNWTQDEVITNIGPVSSGVSRLHHKGKGQLWLYFGTGRYFFEQDIPDDAGTQRNIFGIKDPCYSTAGLASSCPAAFDGFGDLTNVNDITDTLPGNLDPDASSFNGWFINTDTASGTDRSERIITDTIAVSTGLVFFTSFKPKEDTCRPQGKSYLWATKFNTGGDPGALLKGKALLQVSTGSIEEINLSDAFTEEDGRKTGAITGVPPTAQGLSILVSPPPVKRIIHMKER